MKINPELWNSILFSALIFVFGCIFGILLISENIFYVPFGQTFFYAYQTFLSSLVVIFGALITLGTYIHKLEKDKEFLINTKSIVTSYLSSLIYILIERRTLLLSKVDDKNQTEHIDNFMFVYWITLFFRNNFDPNDLIIFDNVSIKEKLTYEENECLSMMKKSLMQINDIIENLPKPDIGELNSDTKKTNDASMHMFNESSLFLLCCQSFSPEWFSEIEQKAKNSYKLGRVIN